MGRSGSFKDESNFSECINSISFSSHFPPSFFARSSISNFAVLRTQPCRRSPLKFVPSVLSSSLRASSLASTATTSMTSSFCARPSTTTPSTASRLAARSLSALFACTYPYFRLLAQILSPQDSQGWSNRCFCRWIPTLPRFSRSPAPVPISPLFSCIYYCLL